MDLLTSEERGTAADRLVALIEAKDRHLSTGFLGTPRLLPVLTETGHTDVAYRLLLPRTFLPVVGDEGQRVLDQHRDP